VLLLAACGDDDESADDDGTTTTTTESDATTTTTTTEDVGEPDGQDEAEAEIQQEPGTVEVVAEGLEVPWDVAFTPDGRTFVTERDTGRLLELDDDGSTREVRTFDIDATGEGGLMGLAVSPDHDDDGWLYVYLTAADDNRVVRIQADGTGEEEILTGIPKASNHNGGVIRFGPDGMLYVGTGDAADPDLAQDPDSTAGKVLRLEPDGSVPGDNPTTDSPVWSLGHRNVQGLAWDADGRLYGVELGPDVDDEVNLIEAGANHGWPDVTGQAGVDGYVDPIAVFQPPEASPSGGVVVEGGEWGGDLVFANLRGQRLWRLELDDGEVVAQEEHLVGAYGRLRDVVQHPDGPLWILTSNRDGRGAPVDEDDRIIALVPPVP
jgi:glucose/arabinose dehydrogenase